MHLFFTRLQLRWLAGLLIIGLSACSPERVQFQSIDITGADYAKSFTLTDHNGQARSLSDFKGKKLALYFYPKDMTPGCTKETCDFQANLPQYKPSKAAVLGVSILDEKSKAK